MSDDPQGSVARPVSLDPFEDIVEVHWGPLLPNVAVLQVGENPVPLLALGDVIDPRFYGSRFFNPIPPLNVVTHAHILNFTIFDAVSHVTENRYTDDHRLSEIINFKYDKLFTFEIYGSKVQDMAARTANSGRFAARPRFVYTAVPIPATVIVRGFKGNTVLKIHEDATISAVDKPLWEFTIEWSDCAGSDLTFSFNKDGRVS